MTVNTELLDEILEITEDVYSELNAEGVNTHARQSVQLAIYEITGANEFTRCAGTESLVSSTSENPNPRDLVIVTMETKDIIRYIDGAPRHVGDAVVNITQKNFTKAQILGTSLPENQKQHFLIDDEKFTVVAGHLKDREGLFWEIVLKRVKS